MLLGLGQLAEGPVCEPLRISNISYPVSQLANRITQLGDGILCFDLCLGKAIQLAGDQSGNFGD